MSEQPGRFAGRVALVTGGASGIGLATVRRFVSEGARVVVGDLNTDALAGVETELGAAVSTLRCDVTEEGDVEALADAALESYGRLDIAFANAGVGGFGRIVDIDVADWTRVLQTNLTGPMLTLKHSARRMRDGGAIIVTASLNAVQAGSGMGAYCSSKAAVAMLVQVAALELGPERIRVNAIGPGLVRTGLTDAVFALPAIMDDYVENTPLGRAAEPEEMAALVAFLASDEASYLSGSMYLADGAAHTKRYPDIPARLAELGA